MSIANTSARDKNEFKPMWETGFDAPRAPANADAERALLGALLVANRAGEYIPDLRPEHFFFALHADIFEAFQEGFAAGRPVSATTLAPRFRDVRIDADTNGAQYLGRLLAEATTVANVREYARTIVDLAQRRALTIVAEDLAARAYDPSERATPSELIEDAERQLFAVATRGRDGRETSLHDAAAAAIKAAFQAHKLGGKLDGVETGLIDLDAKLGGGLGNSDLVVLGGRPSMGKTALATKIALNVARGTQGTDIDTGEVKNISRHVHFFSLEMGSEQLAARLLSDVSGVQSHLIRKGDLRDSQFRLINEAGAFLSGLPMTIEETGGISIGALSAKARREKRKHNTGLIVIDYLQLMQAAPGPSRMNRVQEITEITVGLKALAKELRVPILALSQLSRGLEKQEEKRPQLSDLRESGSIEQDADVVLFVYREEYYWLRKNPQPVKPDPLWTADFEKVAGVAEIIIGKQRHGPIGTVQLAFNGDLTRFDNLARAS